MSENYRLYVQKMAEWQSVRMVAHPLRSELEDLLRVVQRCEAMWTLEDRLDRQILTDGQHRGDS